MTDRYRNEHAERPTYTPALMREKAKDLDELSDSTRELAPSGVITVMGAERMLRSAADQIAAKDQRIAELEAAIKELLDATDAIACTQQENQAAQVPVYLGMESFAAALSEIGKRKAP